VVVVVGCDCAGGLVANAGIAVACVVCDESQLQQLQRQHNKYLMTPVSVLWVGFDGVAVAVGSCSCVVVVAVATVCVVVAGGGGGGDGVGVVCGCGCDWCRRWR